MFDIQTKNCSFFEQLGLALLSAGMDKAYKQKLRGLGTISTSCINIIFCRIIFS
jgi:hypothetical protein